METRTAWKTWINFRDMRLSERNLTNASLPTPKYQYMLYDSTYVKVKAKHN